MIFKRVLNDFYIDFDRMLMDYIKFYLDNEDDILKIKLTLDKLLNEHFLDEFDIINMCIEIDYIMIVLSRDMFSRDFRNLINDIFNLLEDMMYEFELDEKYEICSNIKRFMDTYRRVDYEDFNENNNEI